VPPVLIIVGGLPATGKSSTAERLASAAATPYLRVDRIEQAIVAESFLTHPLGAVGYAVAYALAGEQLRLGLDVIVECVNPLTLTRDAWISIAAGAGAAVVEVELVCSDTAEHRRRVETRATDVKGLVKPSWEEVARREYEPWDRPHLVIDSARTSPAVAAARILDEIASVRVRRSN
jgi:predicted kinase